MNRSFSLLLAASIALPACTTVAPSITDDLPAPPLDSLVVDARVSYRLIAPGGGMSDPSRLLVLFASITPTNGGTITVPPDSFRLVLPDQTVAQVFDPPRAQVLLERTQLAPTTRHGSESTLDELSTGVKQDLRQRLFGIDESETTVSNSGRQGYLVIDTGQPFSSLEGAVLEVSVRNENTTDDLRGTYLFADPPSPGTPLSRLP